jgi:hypothetical protein
MAICEGTMKKGAKRAERRPNDVGDKRERKGDQAPDEAMAAEAPAK